MDFDVPDRLAFRLVLDLAHVRAHAAEHLENRGARRIQADVLDEQVGTGKRGGGDEPEGGAGNVAGHGEIAGLRDLAAVDGNHVTLAAGCHLEGGEHLLGVIAGFRRLDDGGGSFRKHAGEQHGEQQAGRTGDQFMEATGQRQSQLQAPVPCCGFWQAGQNTEICRASGLAFP